MEMLALAAPASHVMQGSPPGMVMSGALKIWTGLLKAGALALALALFGLAGGVAHAHPAQVQMTLQQPHAAAAVHCHQDGVLTMAKHGQHGTVSGDCCGDDCACGCAMMAVAHVTVGVPGSLVMVQRVLASKLLPPVGLAPASLATPPEPRPPLSL